MRNYLKKPLAVSVGADIIRPKFRNEIQFFDNLVVVYLTNVIKLRKRKKVTGTVKVSVTFIMKIFMNRM